MTDDAENRRHHDLPDIVDVVMKMGRPAGSAAGGNPGRSPSPALPAVADPALRAHLEKRASRARAYVEAASSANTRRAYAAGWWHFAGWPWRRRQDGRVLSRPARRSLAGPAAGAVACEYWQTIGQIPRVYVRDSGIAPALPGLSTLEEVLGRPVAGASWEGFVIETLSATAPLGTQCNFCRTAAGAEIDLLSTLPGQRLWAVKIKRSLTPKAEKGFYQACEDLAPQRRIVVFPGSERFPLQHGVKAMSLQDVGRELLTEA